MSFKTSTDNNLDRSYVNCSVVNTTNHIIECKFDQTFQEPILTNSNEYYFCLNRFSISGQNVPLLIFPVKDISVDINVSPLVFTFTYNNLDYQANVIYVSTNGEPLPRSVKSPYYFVYNIQDMVDMFNTTLLTIFNLVKTANPAITITVAPYFIFDSVSGFISLICDYAFSSLVDPWVLSINYNLYKYLSSFRLIKHDSVQNKDYQFIIKDTKNNWYALPGSTITNPPAFLELKQEFQNNADWISLTSIVITTSKIPLRSEIIPLSTTETSRTSYSNNSLQIISDFIPQFDNIGDVRSTYNYQPSLLRMINIITYNPISSIDFQIWFMDTYNNLYPITLLPNTECCLKFGFFKKSTYLS